MNRVVIFFFLSLYATVFGQVLKQPQSYNILPNGHVISTCKGKGVHSAIHFFKPGLGQLSETHSFEGLKLYGIYLTVDSVNIQGGKIVTWAINITGLSNIDEVQFLCKFLANDFHESDTAKINVINETLGAPIIAEYNETYIELYWSSLQSFNVTNYTLRITNTSSGSTTTITTPLTEWTLTQDQPSSNSHPLIITVEAFTDYGSVISASLTTGFPKKLVAINKNDITADVVKKINGQLRVTISFIPPAVFSYQNLYYSIIVENLNDTEMYYSKNELNSTTLVIDDEMMKEGKTYNLSLFVWESLREDVVLMTHKLFSTDFTNTRTPLNSPSPTVPSSRAGSMLTQWYVIAGGIAGLFLVLILLIVFVLIIICLRLRRLQRPTMSQNVMEETNDKMFRERSLSLPMSSKNKMFRERSQTIPAPKTMATNPIYEATTPIYDIMPNDLKGLDNPNPNPIPLPSAADNSLYMDIPPQVPPPRKMSLDSPGIKSGTEVVLSKIAQLGEDPNVENSDYMYMRSQSRYVKSPVPTRPKETTIKPSTLTLPNSRNNEEEREEKK
ncbi:PREDICTED: uncharacterized protein LOC109583760 [Amphimedon queenslandica]|uniref:Cadherin domain-containing protein n=1 Tax=Amphimedon queenslandica TaxID=400682 RepID=A0A1X7UFA0_AMPQE|nr:PREDICTED: uncharacterized protein LOC109583760 [Amphimedon queenslandica]|eukprot:XP_019854765.1 PREDICTED: uncharacterized protein LOC109583760 [Amphimedon queenslandica]